MPDRVKKVNYCYPIVPNRAGQGARILAELTGAGINLLAYSGFPVGGGEVAARPGGRGHRAVAPGRAAERVAVEQGEEGISDPGRRPGGRRASPPAEAGGREDQCHGGRRRRGRAGALRHALVGEAARLCAGSEGAGSEVDRTVGRRDSLTVGAFKGTETSARHRLAVRPSDMSNVTQGSGVTATPCSRLPRYCEPDRGDQSRRPDHGARTSSFPPEP